MENWIIIIFLVGIFYLIISNYDSYTTPTKSQLKDMKKTSKLLIKDINKLIKNEKNKEILKLLISRKRICLEIYKSSVQGVKGQTLAYLVQESKKIGDKVTTLKTNLNK